MNGAVTKVSILNAQGRGTPHWSSGYVDFAPPRANYYTKFLANYGRGYSLRTATCPILWLVVRKGMFSVMFDQKNPLSCVGQI